MTASGTLLTLAVSGLYIFKYAAQIVTANAVVVNVRVNGNPYDQQMQLFVDYLSGVPKALGATFFYSATAGDTVEFSMVGAQSSATTPLQTSTVATWSTSLIGLYATLITYV